MPVRSMKCSAGAVRANTSLASHYNHSSLSITRGRIVMQYPSHANLKYLVGG